MVGLHRSIDHGVGEFGKSPYRIVPPEDRRPDDGAASRSASSCFWSVRGAMPLSSARANHVVYFGRDVQ